MSVETKFQNIPEYLRQEDRWVNWRYESRNGNTTKVLLIPNGRGTRAKSNDPSTWGTFESAVSWAAHTEDKEGNKTLGIGFVLGDGWCGLDLDHVLDKQTREFTCDHAREVIEDLHNAGYAEVSPSGDGLHVIFQADKPANYKSRHSFGGGAELEFYGGGRYFTVTGDTAGFEDFRVTRVADEQIKGLCERFLKTGKPPEQVRPRPVISHKAFGMTQVEKYVQSVIENTSQGEGGRNNKMFSIAGNVAKKVDYDLNETLQYCRDINHKCFSPPLDDRELGQIVSNSILNGDRRIDAQLDYTPIRVVEEQREPADLIKQINKQFERKIPYEKFRESDTFIGAYMRHCQASQHRDTIELDFAGALSALSCILTGKVELEDGTKPNLFIVALADSGKGKNLNRTLNKELLRAIGLERRIGTDGVSSGQGFASSLVEAPMGYYALDECHNIFINSKGMEALNRSLSKTINEVWSANGGQYKPNARSDRSLNVVIDNCAPSLYCTGVPDKWWNGFPEESLTDGLMGRLLVFDCPARKASKDRNRRQYYVSGQRVPVDLVEIAKSWGINPIDDLPIDNGQEGAKIVFRSTNEAFDAFHDFYDECEERSHDNPTPTTPLWTRCYDRITKIALILAANFGGANGEHVITGGHMRMAIKIVKSSIYGIEERLKGVASDESTQLADRMSRFLQKIEKPATLATIINQTGRKPIRLVNEALKWAMEADTIVEYGETPRGKKLYACPAWVAQEEINEEMRNS